MGQRLNLEIEINGMTVANCYYHWSGFTSSSIELAEKAIEAIPEKWNVVLPTFQAAEILIATGGSLDYVSRAAIKEFESNFKRAIISEELKENMKKEIDRNEGIISIVSIGMYETKYWEEARVVLDITNRIVRFGAVWNVLEGDYDDEEVEEIKSRAVDLEDEFDLDKIPFSDFPKFKEKIFEMIGFNQYDFKCKGNLYTMIE